MATQSVPSTPKMELVIPNTPGAPLRPASSGCLVAPDEQGLTSSSPVTGGNSSYADNSDNRSTVSSSSSPAALASQPSSGPVTPAVASQVTAAASAPAFAPASVGMPPPPNHQLYMQRLAAFAQSQMQYGANCTLFVGNLPNKSFDCQLCEMLIARFSYFGTVYCKVNRNPSATEKPTAILQFTNMTSTQVAEYHGNAISIGDRRIRVERSTAVRSLVVSRWDCIQPTQMEVQAMFPSFAIRAFFTPSPLEALRYGLAPCIIVDFANYGHMKTAIRQYETMIPAFGCYRVARYVRP